MPENKIWYALIDSSLSITGMRDEEFRRIFGENPPLGWTQNRNELVKKKNAILREQIERAEEERDQAAQRVVNLKTALEEPSVPENIVVPMELWVEVVEGLSWARKEAHNQGLVERFDEIQGLFEKLTEATKGASDRLPTPTA